MAIGTNTDPYQPTEERMAITRGLLEVLSEHDHPVEIVTKSSRVVRDIDILEPMSAKGLVRVNLSVTTLDRRMARSLEPRAATAGAPTRRDPRVGRGQYPRRRDGCTNHPGADGLRD